MTDSLPFAAVNEATLSVRFSDSPPARSVEVACVVDQTDFGDVVGVEILDLRHQLSGGQVDAPQASSRVRWSYDSEIDAFYVRVTDGRSQVQTTIRGKIRLDASQRVVLLEVPVPPAVR